MKSKSTNCPLAKFLFVAVTFAAPFAQAASLSWDALITNTAGGGATSSEATEWKTGGETVWWDGSGNVAWANGDNATFAGAAGNVRLGGNNATISVGTLDFGVAGYTIDLKDFTDNTANNLTATGLSGSTATITNTSGTTRNFTLDTAIDLAWSGTFTSQRVTFIKKGLGKFAYSGTLPGAFGGTSVDIQAGELEFSGTIPNNTNMGINVANNATLDLAGNGVGLRLISSAASGIVTNSGATASITGLYGGAPLNLQGTVTGNVRFQIRDGNVLTLAGDNTFTGGVTLGGVGLFNTTGTTINVNHNNGLGTGLVDLTSAAGGANGALTLNLRTAAPIVGGLEGQNTSAKNVVLGITGVDTTMEVGSLNTNTKFNGVIRNATGQVGSVIKVGTGSLTLSGANTYTGTTTIKNGSIIIGGGNDRLAATGLVFLGDPGTSGMLVLGDGTARNQTLAGLTITGLGGSVVGGATASSTLTLDIASGTNIFDGVLGGTGTNENKLALTKSGPGTLTLTGTNTYTGNTTVSDGTLKLSETGSIADSAQIQVNSGKILDMSAITGGWSLGATQILKGSGSLTGTATILGTLSPGVGIGTLNAARLILDPGATLAFELDGDATTVGGGINDLVSVTGDLTLDGTLQVTGPNFASAAPGDTYRLFTYSGMLTNNVLDLGSMPGLPGGYTFSVDTSTTGQVNLVVVSSGGATTFGGWAGLNGVTGGVNGDSDNDGIPNGVEYGLDTDPATSDAPPGTYTGTLLSFAKRSETSGNADLSYRIEVSTDLGQTDPWTEVSSYVTNSNVEISASIPTGPVKNFARLRVVVTE